MLRSGLAVRSFAIRCARQVSALRPAAVSARQFTNTNQYTKPTCSHVSSARIPGPRSLCRTFASSAPASGGAAPLTDRIKDDMKAAMKAKDTARLEAIRFLNAAIKSREIELREGGGAVTDEEVIKVIQKLVKQRKDSIDSYKAGGRDDLVAKEQVELQLLEGYLPAMLSAAEVEAVVVQVIAELGVSGPKAMGQVMKAVTARTGGRADNKTVSDIAKAKLSGK